MQLQNFSKRKFMRKIEQQMLLTNKKLINFARVSFMEPFAEFMGCRNAFGEISLEDEMQRIAFIIIIIIIIIMGYTN